MQLENLAELRGSITKKATPVFFSFIFLRENVAGVYGAETEKIHYFEFST